MIKIMNCDIFKSGANFILHQVNCQGVMGSGVAKQVREKHPEVYSAYITLCNKYIDNTEALLGKVQYVPTWNDDKESFSGIVNLFAQDRFGYDGKCYTDYQALRGCLEKVKRRVDSGESIAIPYLMGCHRGGGDWNVVYDIIQQVFSDDSIDVLICKFNGR